MKNRIGERYGMLTAIAASEERDSSGAIKWDCQCDCGNITRVTGTNLTSGRTRSCGCFRAQTSSERAKRLFTKKKVKCSVDDCENLTGPGSFQGLCDKHNQRLRRHGDINYVTTEDERRKLNRVSQLKNVTSVKDTTYRKFMGKHEHRVVAENMLGRKLTKYEHVHHIDGNKHNNSPDNLSVMSARDHLALHSKMREK